VTTANVTVLQGNVTALQGKATADEANITVLQGNVTTLGSSITALQTRATADEANITILQANVTAHTGNITVLQSNVATLQGSNQPQITHLGTLSNLTVSGSATVSGATTVAGVLYSNAGINFSNDIGTGNTLYADGTLYRAGGQAYMCCDDNLYWVRTDGTNMMHLQNQQLCVGGWSPTATLDVRGTGRVSNSLYSPSLMMGYSSSTQGPYHSAGSGLSGTITTPNVTDNLLVKVDLTLTYSSTSNSGKTLYFGIYVYSGGTWSNYNSLTFTINSYAQNGSAWHYTCGRSFVFTAAPNAIYGVQSQGSWTNGAASDTNDWAYCTATIMGASF
jgi:hypothetical protein